MRIPRFHIVAGVVGALVICVSSVAAQMDPGSGSTRQSPATKTDKTRPRNASSAEKPDQAGNEGPKASSETPAKRASEPAAPQPKQPVAPADPVTSLREQIDAAASDQERVPLQLKLVDQLVAVGKKVDAARLLHSMAAEDRFDPANFYNIGNALARIGDSNGAVAAYHKAIDQKKGRYSKALNNLGVVLMRLWRFQEALEAFRTALKLESNRYAEASYNLGRLYAAQGLIDLAVREWQHAIKVDPEHKAAAQAIRQTGFDGRVTVSAQPTPDKRSAPPAAPLPSSASVTPTPTFTVDEQTYNQLQKAREARERGKNDEAVDKYRSVISRKGGYFAPANLELSYVLLGLKRPDEALTYLLPVATRDGARYPISYYHVARIYESQNQLSLAEEAYEQAAKRYKGVNPQLLLDISRVREKRGDYKGAIAAMEEYLSVVELQGPIPDWSEQRLAALRQKLSSSQPKQ